MDLGGLEDLAAAVRPGVGRRGRPAKQQLAAAEGALPGAAPALPAAPDPARLPAAASPPEEAAVEAPSRSATEEEPP